MDNKQVLKEETKVARVRFDEDINTNPALFIH